MHIGVVFPQSEIGTDPDVISDFVTTAEALGYEHLRVYDHVLGATHDDRDPPLRGPYTDTTPFHEPMVLFGFLAARTTVIELVTGVLVLPQRQTALVAKQAAEVDLLSRGRLRLGVGTGWNYVEYQALNEDFSDRGRRQEEQIELLRRLWNEPLLDFSGTWHRVDRASILPRPGRSIPIWLGGFSDIVYRRAARIADGFLFARSAGSAETAFPALRRYVEDEGRDVASFGIDALVQLRGSPDAWRQEADLFRRLGASHITLTTMGEGMSGRQHIEILAPYIESVRG